MKSFSLSNDQNLVSSKLNHPQFDHSQYFTMRGLVTCRPHAPPTSVYRISNSASGSASHIIHTRTARGSRFDRFSQQHMDRTLTIIYLFRTFVNCQTAMLPWIKNCFFVDIDETSCQNMGVSSILFRLSAQKSYISLDVLMD